MTARQWYIYLLKNEVLESTHDDGTQSKRLCRTEILSPNIDWETIWRRVRHHSLPSLVTSFLWKLVNDLLTTEERVNSTVGNTSPFCRYGCHEVVADLEHCFFKCIMTQDVGDWLLVLIEKFGPTSEANILKLDICDNDALVWIVASTLQFCWTQRVSSKKADVQECIAHLRGESELMRNSDLSLLA